MSIPESEDFNDESSLLDFLKSQVPGEGAKTAIMAGHYMLMYDGEQERLVPMVWQDATNPTVEHQSKQLAGNFPVRSFEYGLDLWQDGQRKGGDAKLALLINDHQFQSSHFQKINYDLSKGSAGPLRKEYFRQSNNFPDAFSHLLTERELDKSAVLLANNDPDRDDGLDKEDATILPQESIFFSEQHLRRRFDRHTKKEVSDDPNFELNRLSQDGYKLFYRPNGSTQQVCLTESGRDGEDNEESGCGCSGEVIQFLIELSKRGFQNTILFVPTECAGAVDAGVQAALYVVSRYYDSQVKVTTVAGIGGMGSFESQDANFKARVRLHTLEPDLNI